MANPRDQREGESDTAYGRFLMYRKLGPTSRRSTPGRALGAAGAIGAPAGP
jgi:hypothetical protein